MTTYLFFLPKTGLELDQGGCPECSRAQLPQSWDDKRVAAMPSILYAGYRDEIHVLVLAVQAVYQRSYLLSPSNWMSNWL